VRWIGKRFAGIGFGVKGLLTEMKKLEFFKLKILTKPNTK
jgi:hypothetical protein